MATDTDSSTRSPGRPRICSGWPQLGALMEREGLNDQQLAARLNLKPRTIQSWRLGDNSPRSRVVLKQLAQSLNATEAELIS